MDRYILPISFLIIFIVAIFKRVNIYDSFIKGSRDAISVITSIFPYIISILILIELFTSSGLSTYIEKALRGVLSCLGIPSELLSLIVIRPLSGNGSIGYLESILAKYGADSYIGRCASIIVGASETIMYVAVVYFSTTKVKKLRYAIPVALFSSLIGVIVACAIARIM